VTAAIAESSLHNYIVAVDHDSIGLFQQRPSKGWGRPDQLADPGYATRRFLNALIRNYPAGGWVTGDIGQICQRVQNSAFPAAYGSEAHDAGVIVAQLWTLRATSRGTGVTPPPAKPKKATGPFQRRLMATWTGQGVTDDRHDASMADWNGDRRADLVIVRRSGTLTGRTELYVLDGASNFQRLLLHTGTALPPTDERHAFSVADWNGDGRPDLVVIYKSDTASGRTELQVVDGASGFQGYLLHTATALGPTDRRHAMSVADWNGDGRLDLAVVQKSGTASQRTEVRVLDGASGFVRNLVQAPTALGATDDRYDISVADWNRDSRLDLVVMQKSGTASRRTEVRVLDGASAFKRSLLQARSAEGPTDGRHSLSAADVSGDGRPDLVVVQKSGTASGRTEVRALAG
jgi:FG-GAP-like repeat